MKPESILVVSSDPDINGIMADTIAGLGHRCYTALDCGRAMAVVAEYRIDLIVSDISLPDADGITLMQRARDIIPDTAFVILTGYQEEYSYERILGAGADDFIKKPFTADQFRAKLRRIVSQHRLEAENYQMLNRQAALNERLSTLLALSADLTSELDVDRLFEKIIGRVTEAMKAERTSLYVIDWSNGTLWTKVAEKVEEIRLPLGEGISGRVAETGAMINVADAWELPYYNREYDRKHRFRTRSVLCMPIRNQPGERIGVLQVMNKIGRDHFNKDDEALLLGLASQVGIALENSLLHEEVRHSFDRSIMTLAATVDARHPFTAGHSERVTEYSLLIAQTLAQAPERIEVLKYAALLHDIGKIGIRDKVLLKNGRFTAEERAEMNTHPVKTREILEKFLFPRSLRDVPLIAAHHHERIDGLGYPSGLKGDEIPLGARIMAVADVFDALTSKRDYPKYAGREIMSSNPMPLSKVISILREESGTHLSPGVVTAFLKCLPEALALYRGTHFEPEYVDDVIRELKPELLLERFAAGRPGLLPD